MQPILAESLPRPGRAAAFAVVVAVVASLVMLPSSYRPKHRAHHPHPRIGKCVTASYGYLTR